MNAWREQDSFRSSEATDPVPEPLWASSRPDPSIDHDGRRPFPSSSSSFAAGFVNSRSASPRAGLQRPTAALDDGHRLVVAAQLANAARPVVGTDCGSSALPAPCWGMLARIPFVPIGAVISAIFFRPRGGCRSDWTMVEWTAALLSSELIAGHVTVGCTATAPDCLPWPSSPRLRSGLGFGVQSD